MTTHEERRNRPTHVYRLYDSNDRLIYVGQSQLMSFRMRMHERHSWWFGMVSRIELEMHPNRDAALAAEALAIQEGAPPFNVRHTGRKESDWSHLDAADVAFARAWMESDKNRRFDMPRFLWYHLAGIPLRPFAHLEHSAAA